MVLKLDPFSSSTSCSFSTWLSLLAALNGKRLDFIILVNEINHDLNPELQARRDSSGKQQEISEQSVVINSRWQGKENDSNLDSLL